MQLSILLLYLLASQPNNHNNHSPIQTQLLGPPPTQNPPLAKPQLGKTQLSENSASPSKQPIVAGEKHNPTEQISLQIHDRKLQRGPSCFMENHFT